MTEFPKYLELRKPRSWWLEEVEEVLKVNPLTGSTYLEELGKRAAQQGYSSRAMVINHDCFVKVPRRRIFILGASEEAGGKEAADIAIKKVVDVLEHVRVKALKAKGNGQGSPEATRTPTKAQQETLAVPLPTKKHLRMRQAQGRQMR